MSTIRALGFGLLLVIPSIVGAQESIRFPAAVTHASGGSRLVGPVRTLLIGAALTGLASRYDQRATRTLTAEGGWWDSDVLDAGNTYGNGVHLAALSGLTWGIGGVAGNPRLRKTGETLLLGLAIENALVTSIKFAANRRRPDGSDRRSFPSGHTAGAFTFSTIVARRHGSRFGIPAYALASLTAIARIEENKHYASDVVAGATLGIIIGRLVTRSDGKSESRLQVFSQAGRTGLQVSF